ncbi:hypothetical protein BC831DRAFT_512876, partial [Entophlyctis helioformis]
MKAIFGRRKSVAHSTDKDRDRDAGQQSASSHDPPSASIVSQGSHPSYHGIPGAGTGISSAAIGNKSSASINRSTSRDNTAAVHSVGSGSVEVGLPITANGTSSSSIPSRDPLFESARAARSHANIGMASSPSNDMLQQDFSRSARGLFTSSNPGGAGKEISGSPLKLGSSLASGGARLSDNDDNDDDEQQYLSGTGTDAGNIETLSASALGLKQDASGSAGPSAAGGTSSKSSTFKRFRFKKKSKSKNALQEGSGPPVPEISVTTSFSPRETEPLSPSRSGSGKSNPFKRLFGKKNKNKNASLDGINTSEAVGSGVINGPTLPGGPSQLAAMTSVLPASSDPSSRGSDAARPIFDSGGRRCRSSSFNDPPSQSQSQMPQRQLHQQQLQQIQRQQAAAHDQQNLLRQQQAEQEKLQHDLELASTIGTTLLAHNNELQKLVEETQEAYRGLEQERSKLSEELKAQMQLLNEARNAKKSLEDERNSARGEAEEAATQITRLKTQLRRIHLVDAEKELLHGRISELETSKANLATALESVRREMFESAREKETLAEKVRELTSENHCLQDTAHSIRNAHDREVNDLRRIVGNLEEDKMDLLGRVEELAVRLEESEARTASAVAAARSHVAGTPDNESVSSSGGKLSQIGPFHIEPSLSREVYLQSELEELQQALETAASQNNEYKEMTAELQETVQALREELENMVALSQPDSSQPAKMQEMQEQIAQLNEALAAAKQS